MITTVRRNASLAVATLAVVLIAAAAAHATTYTVTSATDGAPGSLRDLVAHSTLGDTIELPDPRLLAVPATSYVLTGGTIVIDHGLTIEGKPRSLTTYDFSSPVGGITYDPNVPPSTQSIVVDARGTGRAFTVTSGNATLSYFAITGGNGTGGGTDGFGGGVLAASGTGLALHFMNVFANHVTGSGATTVGGGGVAAVGTATLQLLATSVSQNTLTGGTGQAVGGGVFQQEPVPATPSEIENTQIVQNIATSGGGAVHGGGLGSPSGYVDLIGDTIADNTASANGHPATADGGNVSSGTGGTDIKSTLIAGGVASTAGTEDCAGQPFTEQTGGHNLVQTPNAAVCPMTAAEADRSGTPGLDTVLRNNGGWAPTLALLPGSPAIGNGAPGCNPFTLVASRAIDVCDIGAFPVMAPTTRIGDVAYPSTLDEPQPSFTTEDVFGRVNGNLDGTTFHLAYGPDLAGQIDPARVLVTPDRTIGGSDTSVAYFLHGLAPGTTYHVDLVATTAFGTAHSASQYYTAATFSTEPQPTGDMRAVKLTGRTTATLSADTQHHASVTCHFEYGTTTRYGSLAPCPSPVLAGNGGGVISAALTKLKAGTKYHARLVLGDPTDGAATFPSPDKAFTTLKVDPQVTAITTAMHGTCPRFRLAAVISASYCRTRYTPPAPGTLTITWSAPAGSHHKLTRIATLEHVFKAVPKQPVVLTLKLSRSGKALLRKVKRHHSITISKKVTFVEKSPKHTYTASEKAKLTR